MKLIQKTRTKHYCKKCGRIIPKGSKAIKGDAISWVKGKWGTEYFHTKCY